MGFDEIITADGSCRDGDVPKIVSQKVFGNFRGVGHSHCNGKPTRYYTYDNHVKLAGVVRTENELVRELREQIQRLKMDARNFDDGEMVAVKNLSIAVRVLVHDTGRSESLLKLVGRKMALAWLDTATPLVPGNRLRGHSTLTCIHMFLRGSPQVVPLLDTGLPSRTIEFDYWWNGLAVVDVDGHEYSRRDIVLGLAHNEGGHVKRKRENWWKRLRHGRQLSVAFVDPLGVEHPPPDVVPMAMRQIVHEVIKTLEPDYVCEHREAPGLTVLDSIMTNGPEPLTLPESNMVVRRSTENTD